MSIFQGTMGDLRLFQPVASAKLAVTAASGNVAVPGTFPAGVRRNVRLVNGGDNECFVAFGTSNGITATVDTTMYIGANKSAEIFELAADITHIAAICNSGETTDLFITTGTGI
jgi:hypothetical protein